MDVIVTPAEGGTVWQLTNLLGRSMGRIAASAPRQLLIYSEGHASAYSKGLPSLDVALAEIERRTRGVCLRNPGEDQLETAPNNPTRRRILCEFMTTARRFMYFTGNALILPLNIHALRAPDLERPDCLHDGTIGSVREKCGFSRDDWGRRMWAPGGCHRSIVCDCRVGRDLLAARLDAP
jgi:hypothetical protein